MVIAVDFDGTIVEHCYPKIGDERPFATDILKKLIADRHQLVLWTVRDGQLLEDAIKWCEERGVTFYSVNSERSAMFNEERNGNFSRKLNADVFIDDCNIGGLPDWPTIYKIISQKKTYKQIIRQTIMDELEEAEPPAPKWMFWKKSSR